MISRENKKVIDQYLTEMADSHSDNSIRCIRTHLIILLTFLGQTPFDEIVEKGVGYKKFLREDYVRRDGKQEPLSHEYMRKNLDWVRLFLLWLREEGDFLQIKTSWLQRHFTFTTRENNQARKDAYVFNETLQESEIWFTIDEIQKIALTPVTRLIDERTRAACIFLLLSGMRIGAFLTLPLQAVNIEKLLIRQWTSLGVHTKLGKNATTSILNLGEYPELIEVVRSWDAKVRAISPPEGFWFPNIHPLTGELDPVTAKGQYRASGFSKDLYTFLVTKVGMPYKSAHKFRHGHIRLLRDRVERFDDIEAIAHNCMQTVETMLRYARMSENSAQKRIHQMAQRKRTNFSGEKSLTDIDPQTIRLVQNLLSSMLPNDSRRF